MRPLLATQGLRCFLGMLMWVFATQALGQSTPSGSSAVLEEVTVTATRREEPLSKVALSITAFDAEQMEARGVRNFEDLVRLSPGLNLTKNSATGASRIAINGISSSAGSATTGIYIDDTPIQVRNLGFGASTSFPGLFDIERVEVLRGPQGTLFGAGSEGGTVRFITTEPNLRESSLSVRSEVATLAHGEPTYELGTAAGGPIIADKLAYRFSAFYRREGGWIDGVDGTYSIKDPTGAPYGDSVAFTKTSTLAKDINWNRTVALRGALKWQVSDAITVSPSIFYQKHHLNDGAGDVIDLSTSNIGNRDYSRQYYRAGAPGTSFTAGSPPVTTILNAMDAPTNAFGDDEFTLTSLGINWDLGFASLFSNTSYFDRKSVQWYDYTKGYAQYYMPQFFTEADGVTPSGTYVPLGWKGMSQYNNGQGNFVQELRLQSKDPNARLNWLIGAFYAHNRQTAQQPISTNFMQNSNWIGFYPSGWGYGYWGQTDGAPFGPGHSAVENFFGDQLLPNAVSFLGKWGTVEKQTAGFLQLDWTLFAGFKVTAGVRVGRNDFNFNAAYLGPENNSIAPFGGSSAYCATPDVNGFCSYGTGDLAPIYPLSSSHNSETSTTPKIGVAYQIDDANLIYATAAKGYRPAGASLRTPSICDFDLVQNGYVDASGNPIQPTTYKSDSVWSYELGSKNHLAGGRLLVEGSVFQIKWKNIQANVSLPNCSYNFVDNLADATSKGFNFDFQYRLTSHFDVSGSYGYNKPTFDRDAKSPGGKIIYNGGSSIPDAGPPVSMTLSGTYTVPLSAKASSYLRLDYNRSTEWRRYGTTDPGTSRYDARMKPVPAYDVLNLRAGIRLGNFDISAFVQNLQNRAPWLQLDSSTYYDPQDWQALTLRPRTYGLTFMWSR